jgi:arabinofuranosyltransferase
MRRWQGALLGLFALLWVSYAGAFIYRTSFVISGQRYFALFDDAMISMSYARTLAQGHGLVWYPGAERVEGFTNLLWTLYMAALHLTGAGAPQVCLLVQLSALALLAVNLALAYRLALTLTRGSFGAGLASLVLIGFYLPLNTWGLQGMEVAALAPLVTGGLLLAARRLDACAGGEVRPPGPWLYGVLGLGTLLRPDAAVLLAVFTAYLAWADRAQWRRHIGYGCLSLVLFVGAQTLFRWSYYGDLLPNTYYLKMTGYPALLRVSRGLIVLLAFVVNTNWLLCVVPFLALLLRPSRSAGLVAAVVLVQAAYSAYAGGDVWEDWGGANRYLSIVMPGFLVIFAWSLQQGVAAVRAGLQTGGADPGRARRLVTALAGALVVLATVDFAIPNRLDNLKQLLLWQPPLYVTGNHATVELALQIREFTSPRARLGVLWAGSLPYFAERPAVDILGKSDRAIARLVATPPASVARFWVFSPGHTKWDMRYTLEEQRPDVIPFLFPQMQAEAQPALGRLYDSVQWGGGRLWWRRGSSEVNVAALRRAAALANAARSD